MNIAHIEEKSFIYGPGCRFVIWVQGCSIHCKGCWNTEMWAFEKKIIFFVQDLLYKIVREAESIDGITLLGGEPLDQFSEVSELLIECGKIGLSTMLFTGYEMTEIADKQMTSILNNLDILITGRYDKTKRTMNHQWLGSTNQEIHFLTDRYADYEIENNNYTEITINEDGSTTILGFPEKNFLESEIANAFASTLPKPHKPTLQPKLYQRACKANAPRKIVLKNLPTLKKLKTLTHEPTQAEK